MEKRVNINIRAIQHIGIPVADIAVSRLFYERLGFTSAMEASFGQEPETGTCIMMKKDDILIELYQLPENLRATIKTRGDGHIDHIAFDVADIDDAFITLKHGGFNLLEAAPVLLPFWQNGCKYFNITGPDGERLEFNQIL